MYEEGFTIAVSRLLELEGGYVDDPDDRGGATNYGISLRYLRLTEPAATADSIRNLTKDDAIRIYYRDWWKRYRLDEIQSTAANKLLEVLVHMGPRAGVRIVQSACVALGESLVVDGYLGSLSIGSINKLAKRHPRCFLMSFSIEQIRYYNSLKKPKFLSGWINRALRY